MIDIIMPVYNARSTLFATLCSIAFQSIKDKLVLHIVDDCSSEAYDDIVNKFSSELNIKIYKLDKNSGPGMARQFILEKTSNEYIVFMDSDDLFYSHCSLEKLYKKICSTNSHYVSGMVFNEKNHVCGYTLSDLHGKIYRRSFLKEKKISFPNSRVHEDNVFNNLVRVNNPKTSYVSDAVYFYSNNAKSITSVSDDIEFQRLKIYIENTELIIKKAFENNCLNFFIKQVIFEKTKYLSTCYKELSYSKRKTLKYLVDSSLLNSKYLEYDDYDKMRIEIFNDNLDKYNS